jgi:hypothetical protein
MLSALVYPNYSLPLKLSNIYFGELLLDMSSLTHTILYCFITHLYFCAEIGGRLLDGVWGSNPAGFMDVCLS